MVAVVLEILIRGAQIGVTVCLVAAAVRPTAVDVRRFGALVAAISLTAFTTGSSGYAQIFLLFLLFYEPWRGPVRIAMLMGAFFLCLPIDYAFRPVVHGWAHSYLGERDVMVSFGVSVGQLVRPGILLVIQYGLIGINLSDLFDRGPVRFSDGEAAPCVAAASANR